MMHFPIINELLRVNDLSFMIILYLEKDVYSFEESRKSSGGFTQLYFQDDAVLRALNAICTIESESDSLNKIFQTVSDSKLS